MAGRCGDRGGTQRGRYARGSRGRTSAARQSLLLLATALLHAAGLWLIADLLPARFGRSGLPPSAIVARDSDSDGAAAADSPPLEIETLVDRLRTPEEQSAEEKRRAEEQRKSEEDPGLKGQVVDIARPAIEEHPDEARFLAEYDSKVAQETRGRVGRDRAGGAEEVAALESHRAPAQEGRSAGQRGRVGPSEPSRAPSGQIGQGGSSGEIATDGDQRRAGAPGLPSTGRPSALRGEGGFPGDPNGARPNLQPTEDMLARAMARGGGSPDYLKDVDDGESTALNAKKFKFASFFNRVKRAVSDEWHPDLVYLRHDASGHVYGNKDRITTVRVHLHPDGRLQTVTMLDASGVDFLDDEAMDAIKRAQPFVNPPPQLVDADGLIHFNFGFIFELSGHTTFKVFKYR